MQEIKQFYGEVAKPGSGQNSETALGAVHDGDHIRARPHAELKCAHRHIRAVGPSRGIGLE